MGKIKTKDGSLEVSVLDVGTIDVRSPKFNNVAFEVNALDPSDPETPPNALYKITIYQPTSGGNLRPSEYDTAWVLSDGKILKRGEEYLQYMRKHVREA